MRPLLTLRSHAKRGVSKGGPKTCRLATLRDAALRAAPQGEEFVQSARELLEIPR